jgi:murein DD-endopeptidase MepM/ murein hydrolase activator NlpD
MVRKHSNGTPKPHQGWDIAAAPGTDVFAITNGVIEFVKDDGVNNLGKQVCLSFEYNGRTLYAVYGHLSEIDVAEGMFVMEGEQLGKTGQTGNATGQALSEAHLHLEIRTQPHAGLGLPGRQDPMTVLGYAPILEVIFADMPTFGPIPK